MIANSGGLYHELDHRHLVDECRRVFNAGGDLFRRLVQTARQLDVFAFSCSAVAGAALSAFELTQTDRQWSNTSCRALDAVSRLDLMVSFVIFVRLYFNAGSAWLAWRYLRPAYVGADLQFHFIR